MVWQCDWKGFRAMERSKRDSCLKQQQGPYYRRKQLARSDTAHADIAKDRCHVIVNLLLSI